MINSDYLSNLRDQYNKAQNEIEACDEQIRKLEIAREGWRKIARDIDGLRTNTVNSKIKDNEQGVDT